MEKTDAIAIEFIKNQPPYLAGEKTTREPRVALLMVSLGVAKFRDPPPGLDEFGNALEPRDPPVKPRAKRKRKSKAKPKGKA